MDVLRMLPPSRKRIGNYYHRRIYRVMQNTFHDYAAFNAFVGNVLPASWAGKNRRLYFEVNLGCRIPDAIVTLETSTSEASSSAVHVRCYIFEFKTTCAWSSRPREAVLSNKVHRSQYVQGLKQLVDSVTLFRDLSTGVGRVWEIVPVIVFFRQRPLAAVARRVFRGRRYVLSDAAVADYLASHQDESTQAFLSKSGLRTARPKHAAMSRRVPPPAARRIGHSAASVPRRSAARPNTAIPHGRRRERTRVSTDGPLHRAKGQGGSGKRNAVGTRVRRRVR
uniref:GP76 n=1 Tax=Caviid herpesvirus 2 str. CIDMTR TaxID=1415526 RepID=U6H9W7_9BETA|nr:GP76 [Caviid herpesvirus 2 str. CIDMTR]